MKTTPKNAGHKNIFSLCDLFAFSLDDPQLSWHGRDLPFRPGFIAHHGVILMGLIGQA
jgi:hypothetical protein